MTFDDIVAVADEQIFIVLPPEDIVFRLSPTDLKDLPKPRRAERISPASAIIAATKRAGSRCLTNWASEHGAPLVAVNDVHYHGPERKPLADVITCIREKCTIAEAGFRLAANAERYLKSPDEMARLFRRFPDAITRTQSRSPRPASSHSTNSRTNIPMNPYRRERRRKQHLEDLTWAGAKRRYPKELFPNGIPDDVQQRLFRKNCAIIARIRLRALFPHRSRRRRLCARTKRFFARGAAPPPIVPSAFASASPRSIPTTTKPAVRPLHFGKPQ